MYLFKNGREMQQAFQEWILLAGKVENFSNNQASAKGINLRFPI
jgi:hypothetical protein